MEKKNLQGISMLPDGLLSASLKTGEKKKDIQITEMSEEGFMFRSIQDRCSPECFELRFYDMEKAGYSTVILTEFEVCRNKKDDFFSEFLVWTEQENYSLEVRKLARQYGRYIRLKLEDDGGLEKELTGYPSDLDAEHWECLDEQKRHWFAGSKDDPEIHIELPEAMEFALELDRPELYRVYLRENLSDFYRRYLKENYAWGSGLERRCPERIYVGNQFCHLLFPKEEILFSILKKAQKEGVKVTLSFTYVREEMISESFALLKKIDQWCDRNHMKLECVLNDWGMADFIKKETEHLIPCLGTLLNKRKKDPRISFKKGDHNLYRQNSFNAEFYREFLKNCFGIESAEWETCGYVQQIPSGKNSLHFPFYQTNTSQYCPLCAVIKEGSRGRQRLVRECPQYCERSALLYPKHLNMVGRYNSLFALDSAFLKNPKQLKIYADSEIDRLVLNLL